VIASKISFLTIYIIFLDKKQLSRYIVPKQIKARYEAGETLNDLTNAYGISHQHIWQIIRGKSK